MAKITPNIGMRGTFVLKNPWITNQGEQYEITAIRTLQDLAKASVDAKTMIYAKMGLNDGQGGFNWADEVKKDPFFVTLYGTQGNKIIVPDTYIEQFPDLSPVKYHRVFIAVSIGQFPEDETFDDLANDLADLAQSRTGMTAVGKPYTTPLLMQPTAQEHQSYMDTRLHSKPDVISNDEEITKLKAENAKQRETITALINKLEAHNLLP